MLKFKLSAAVMVLTTFVLFTWNCNNPATPPVLASQSTTAYGKDATVFSLCWLANINGSMIGSPAALQQHATAGVNAVLSNDTTKNLIGTWTVLWGPVTYTHDTSLGDSCITDNTMMLLKGSDPANPSKTMYVIGIAGTNSISVYDWSLEDFDVQSMVMWPAPPAAGANNLAYFGSATTVTDTSTTNKGNYISNGICTGINNLMNKMVDGNKGTLMEYLKNNVGNTSGDLEIAVAGHSLGGGLSPVAALVLKDNQGYWNPAGNFTITTYPFAGQSPGNNNFAQYLGQKFTGKFHGKYNVLDVVPHGFDPSMMPQIPALYNSFSPYLQNECVIGGIINCINSKLEGFGYKTLYQPVDTFTGQINNFNPTVVYDLATTTGWKDLGFTGQVEFGLLSGQFCKKEKSKEVFGRTGCFAGMALEEHIQAYINYYQIKEFSAVMTNQMDKSKAPSGFLQELINASKIIKSCL